MESKARPSKNPCSLHRSYTHSISTRANDTVPCHSVGDTHLRPLPISQRDQESDLVLDRKKRVRYRYVYPPRYAWWLDHNLWDWWTRCLPTPKPDSAEHQFATLTPVSARR